MKRDCNHRISHKRHMASQGLEVLLHQKPAALWLETLESHDVKSAIKHN